MDSHRLINFKPKQNELGFDNLVTIPEAFDLNEKERIKLINEFLKSNKTVNDTTLNLQKKKIELHIHDVYITLSVQEIYKKIIKENLFNWRKFTFLQIYCTITLIFVYVLFLIIISYFRPALITNNYSCFDQHSLGFITCHFRNFCQCDYTYSCVSFCYEEDDSSCIEQFKHENTNVTALTAAGKMRFIKYNKHQSENRSLFQSVNKYYCYSPYYLFGLICSFSFGGGIGYAFAGPLADVYGKKKIISIQLIGLLITLFPLCILSHFSSDINFNIQFSLWCFGLVLFGLFLLPFDSCMFVYLLENHPENEKLKTINVVNIVKEIIALGIYFIYEDLVQNVSYFMHLILLYLTIFTIVFIFVMKETPRFYSERPDDIELKAQAIRFYMKPWTASDIIKEKKILFDGYKRIAIIKQEPSINNAKVDNSNEDSAIGKETIPLVKTFNENNNISNITEKTSKLQFHYGDIRKKYCENKHINKHFTLIFVCWMAITMCFYAITFCFIRQITDPNLFLDKNQKIGVLIYLAVFTALVIPLLNKLILEMFSFEGMIPILLIMFTLFTLINDLPELNRNAQRIEYFGNFIERYYSAKNLYINATALWLITWIVHIYEFLVLRQAPTLYRSSFFFNLRAFCQIGLFIVVISAFSLEYFTLLIGLIGLVTTLLLYSLKVPWKYEMFEELKDIETQNLI